jgi:hypothetical protein
MLFKTYNASKFPFHFREEVKATPVENNEMSP